MWKWLNDWLTFDDEICVILQGKHFWVDIGRDKDV